MINDGNSPIVDGTVAIWNTSHITESGFYSIRIITSFQFNKNKLFYNISNFYFLHSRLQNHLNNVYKISEAKGYDMTETNYITNIYFDTSIKKGWPQRLNEYYVGNNEYYWGGFTEPVVSDIDNDGDMEIFVHFGGRPPLIYAFNDDGSYLEGWPVAVDNEDLPGCTGSPSIADINNDGVKDIVVSGRNGIYIFNNDGSLQNLFELKRSNDPHVETLLYDLDNDGNLEIIRKCEPDNDRSGEEIVIFNSNGVILDNWPKMFYNFTGPDGSSYSNGAFGPESSLSIGNFDDDSDMEIVAAGIRNVFDDPDNPYDTWHGEGQIVVYNLDGTILDGFPIEIDGVIFNSPSIGDINMDGYDEIVIGSTTMCVPHSSSEYGLHVIDRFGNDCIGWPKLIGERITSSAALADFNDDGFLEIVVSSLKKRTYVFDYMGNILSGWPQTTIWRDYRSPSIGDINGDGELDIVVAAGNGVDPDWLGKGGIYAWNKDGTLIEGFPKVTECDAQAAPTIADIDQDGKVEIIASSDLEKDFVIDDWKSRCSIYVWELEGDLNLYNLIWPMFHRDLNHSGNILT